jgi:protein SCO1/2
MLKKLLFILMFTSSAVVWTNQFSNVDKVQGVGIISHLGDRIDLTAKFKDETGQSVYLGQFFQSNKPVIISPVFFSCRSLCNYHLNGLIDSLKNIPWSAGQKYELVALGFDERENHEMAKDKKDSYMRIYSRPGTENGFHFLTSDKETIERMTDQLGFKFRWNPEMNEWAHPSAAIIITPDGVISRYLPGVYFEKSDIKLALNESVNGRLGNFLDRLILYCFKYDELKSKYTVNVINILKVSFIGAILVVFLITVFLWLRQRRQKIQDVVS